MANQPQHCIIHVHLVPCGPLGSRQPPYYQEVLKPRPAEAMPSIQASREEGREYYGSMPMFGLVARALLLRPSAGPSEDVLEHNPIGLKCWVLHLGHAENKDMT